jgi:hypothetical protein
MKRTLLAPALLVAAFAVHATPGMAQTDLTMLGGATGATAYCIQAGDLTNGLFVGTFFQTGVGTWEEHLKGGSFKFQETKREELLVEILDSSRSASVQFDFVGKTIKYSVTNPPQWKERYVISSAVDKAGSADCIKLSSLPGAPGGPPLPAGANVKLIQFIGIPPKTVFSIPTGTKITAMTGPPCPASIGAPVGSILSPGGKECHPPGSVACPASRGGGFCPAGQFCDAFSFSCIAAGDARLCPIQPSAFETGQNLHCALGETCTLPNPRPCDDGGGGQTAIKSDIRLKHDIVKLGALGNGIGLYRFRYTWSDQAYVGVMAQEVETIMPEAVQRGADGYLRVNYDKVGLRFQTWEAWGAATTEDRRGPGAMR